MESELFFMMAFLVCVWLLLDEVMGSRHLSNTASLITGTGARW